MDKLELFQEVHEILHQLNLMAVAEMWHPLDDMPPIDGEEEQFLVQLKSGRMVVDEMCVEVDAFGNHVWWFDNYQNDVVAWRVLPERYTVAQE